MKQIKYDQSKGSEDWAAKDIEIIRKGCPNKQCFCTGACQEIVGWREREVFGLGSLTELIKNNKLGI